MTRFRFILAAVGAALAVGSVVPGSASADIYWTNETGNSIGRAHNDGSGETLNFVTGATGPRGVAIGGGYVYWSHGGPAPASGRIGRAKLDGTGTPDQALVTMGGTAPTSETSPSGIAVDGGHVYWTHVFASGCTTPPCGKVGRATLDGGTVEQQFIQPFFSSIGATPCGLAVEPDHLYWATSGANVIARAHGPFDVDSDFLTGASNPCGVAFAAGIVYWANRGTGALGRANTATGDVSQSFIDAGAGNTPCGVAVDVNYVYWTTTNGKIWRWRRDGSRGNVIDSLVTDALGPCGIAVDPTASASPSTHDYGTTTVGGEGDAQAFAIQNTSSSVLDVAGLALLGANPGDFRLTGDGCTVGGIASGGLCILNVQFAPTAAGTRTATLRVTSNATDSPVDIALSGVGSSAGGGIGLGGSATPLGIGTVIPPPARDAAAPRVRRTSVNPSVFRVDDRGGAEAPVTAVSRGTVFRYTLSEAARVLFTIDRSLPGRRVGRRCVPPTRSNGGRARCTRYVRAGRFARTSIAGRNAKRFSGKIGRGKLLLGKYRARLVATDVAGNASGPRFVWFDVVR